MKFKLSGPEDVQNEKLIKLIENGCILANVPVDHEGLTYPALNNSQVIIASTDDDVFMGFVYFYRVVMPETNRPAIMERFLYVTKKYRGAHFKVADGLVHMLERVAREEGLKDVFAGSSLNNNEAARRVYQRAGFKTTYAFKKELD